jgi:peptidoglycan/LPS O-acetylase OafA/YrhL
MALVLTEKYTGKGSGYLFYTNRALKIYPVYWLNLILLVALNLVVFSRGYPGTFDFYFKYQPPSWWALSYLVITNVIVIGLDWVFLFGINRSGNLFFTKNFNAQAPNVYNYAFNSIAWTVGIELLFYVIAPWLNKRKWTILLLLFTLSFVLRLLFAFEWGDMPPWNYMFFPTQLMFFIAGMLAYRFIDVVRLNWGKHLKTAIYLAYLAVVLCYYQFFAESYYKQAALFLCVTLCTPFAFDLTKKSKLDRLLGNLSYPIYITQELAIHLTASKRFPIILDKGLTTLLLDILLSVIIYKTVTVYWEKIRANRVKQFKQI